MNMIVLYYLTLVRNDHKYVITQELNDGPYHLYHGASIEFLTESTVFDIMKTDARFMLNTKEGDISLRISDPEHVSGLLDYADELYNRLNVYEVEEFKPGVIRLIAKAS